MTGISIDANIFDIPPMFLYGTASGFVGAYIVWFATQYVLIPKFLPQSFREKVDKLATLKEKKNLYSTFPSMAQALVQCSFHPLFIFLQLSPEHAANRVTYFDYGWPAFFSGIFVGYLIADFVYMGPVDLGAAYCLHHLAAIVSWVWMNRLGAMQWYASMLQFAEFSTILLNVRQWVLTTGYPSSSPMVKRVSLSFFLAFFVVRVAPLPCLIYLWLTNDFAQLSDEKGLPVAVLGSCSLTIHVLLQSLWFLMMVRKMVKMVTKPKTKKEEN